MALPLHSQNWQWTKFLQSLQRDLKRHGFPENLSGALTGAMGEMVDNVWQHSESSMPGLAGYEVARRRLNFAVADLGIGILQSIRKNPSYHFLNSSMEALQKAILRGVSRFRDQGRGYGFSTLLQSVAELWGFTRLRSSEAVLVFDRRVEKRRRLQKYLPPLPGVQIAVSCGLDCTEGPDQ
jgi:anti-sigma regulatory factor (Ser/Thr protein kinase)